MKHRLTLGIIVCTAILLIGCGRNSRTIKSEDELKKILTEAFMEGDIDTLGSLHHPSIDPKLKEDLLAVIEPVFLIKPTTVVSSVVMLSEAPMDLPGELKGQKLKYTTDIAGVIFLDGQYGENGADKVGLYFPFSQSSAGYTLAGFGYESED